MKIPDRIPYTYLIGWSKLNKWYYGRQASKNCNPSNLFRTYFTSSKIVKDFIKEHGTPDIIQVRKVFKTIDGCVKCEHLVLQKIFKSGNKKLWLNINFSNGKINSTNMAKAKIKETNRYLGLVSLKDPRWSSGEIVGWNKNFTPNSKQLESLLKHAKMPKSKEHKEKISLSNKGKHNNSGSNNPRFDKTIYHFKNLKSNLEFIGTRFDFSKTHEISKGNLCGVIGNQQKSKGWILVKILSMG